MIEASLSRSFSKEHDGWRGFVSRYLRSGVQALACGMGNVIRELVACLLLQDRQQRDG